MRKIIAASAIAAASVGIILSSTSIASAAASTFPGAQGVYRVNYDIRPGTYTTQGALIGGYQSCTWVRAAITPNGPYPIAFAETMGPTTVTIESTDDIFITSGCGDWVRENDTAAGSLDSGSLTGSLDSGSLTGSLAGGLLGSTNNGSSGSLAGSLLGSLMGR